MLGTIKGGKKRKTLETKRVDKNICCISNFIKEPSITRAGTVYSKNQKCRPMHRTNQTVSFGSISVNALSALDVPHEAKSVSRKVKILCLCMDCIGKESLLEKTMENRTGVVCIQIKESLPSKKVLKAEACQTDIFQSAGARLFCNFRKTIGVKKSSSDRHFLKKVYKKRSLPKLNQKKAYKRKKARIIKNVAVAHAKRRRRKGKSKSLLKYVLKKEALKNLTKKICRPISSSEETLEELQRKMNVIIKRPRQSLTVFSSSKNINQGKSEKKNFSKMPNYDKSVLPRSQTYSPEMKMCHWQITNQV